VFKLCIINFRRGWTNSRFEQHWHQITKTNFSLTHSLTPRHKLWQVKSTSFRIPTHRRQRTRDGWLRTYTPNARPYTLSACTPFTHWVHARPLHTECMHALYTLNACTHFTHGMHACTLQTECIHAFTHSMHAPTHPPNAIRILHTACMLALTRWMQARVYALNAGIHALGACTHFAHWMNERTLRTECMHTPTHWMHTCT